MQTISLDAFKAECQPIWWSKVDGFRTIEPAIEGCVVRPRICHHVLTRILFQRVHWYAGSHQSVWREHSEQPF